MTDEERIQALENELEVTILYGGEVDRKYEDVCDDSCVTFLSPVYV